jgi:small ubiquitin-related modifier
MVQPGGGGGDEVDRKPVIKPGVHLTLKVQDTAGRTMERTLRRTEKLQGLMDAYYAKVPDVTHGTGRFLYDGKRLAGWQTPAELEMEEGDEIDFFTELMGGGGPAAAAVEQPVAA